MTLITDMQRQTTMRRLGMMLRNIVTNLPRLTEVPALHIGRFTGPAFIVGGGPSLAQLTPELAAVMRERGIVLAVNTSEKPLRERGITPDLAFTIESGATSFQVAESPHAQRWALDLSCHPDTFDAAKGRAAWFCHESVHLMRIARALGVRPLWYGPAGPSAAFTYARQLGCSPIVFVGCDFAYARDGRMYDPGTHWHEIALTDTVVDGERTVGTFTPSAKRDEVMRGIGLSPIPNQRTVYKVDAADGGEPLWTTPEFLGLREWLAAEIAAMPAGSVVQTGLATLPGAMARPIWEALACRGTGNYARNPEMRGGTTSTPAQIASALARIRREADTLDAAADAILSGAPLPFGLLADGVAFASAWATPALLRYQMSDTSADDVTVQPRVVAQCWKDAAREMLEVLR